MPYPDGKNAVCHDEDIRKMRENFSLLRFLHIRNNAIFILLFNLVLYKTNEYVTDFNPDDVNRNSSNRNNK